MLLAALAVLPCAPCSGEIIPCLFREPLHPARPPLTTWLLVWLLHQQAVVGRQDTGFSELSWLTISHLGRAGVDALCAFYYFDCCCHPAFFLLAWWCILSRMPICFLPRQDRLCHMSCPLATEAHIELTSDIIPLSGSTCFSVSCQGDLEHPHLYLRLLG